MLQIRSAVLNFNEYIEQLLVISKTGNSCNMDCIELTHTLLHMPPMKAAQQFMVSQQFLPLSFLKLPDKLSSDNL